MYRRVSSATLSLRSPGGHDASTVPRAGGRRDGGGLFIIVPARRTILASSTILRSDDPAGDEKTRILRHPPVRLSRPRHEMRHEGGRERPPGAPPGGGGADPVLRGENGPGTPIGRAGSVGSGTSSFARQFPWGCRRGR